MQATMIDLKHKFHNKGFRITEQEGLYLIFSKYKGEHFTSEEIFNLVSQSNSGIGLATVYRTLSLLEKMELLNKILLDNGYIRYEPNNKEKHHFHHHIIMYNL